MVAVTNNTRDTMTTKRLMHVSFMVSGVVELEHVEEGVLCHVRGVRISSPDFFKTGEEAYPDVVFHAAVRGMLTEALVKMPTKDVEQVNPVGNTQPTPDGKQ